MGLLSWDSIHQQILHAPLDSDLGASGHKGAVDAPTTPSGQGRATPQGVELGAGHTYQPGSGDDTTFGFCHEDVDVVGRGRDAVRQVVSKP
jgi:hypothetical protein